MFFLFHCWMVLVAAATSMSDVHRTISYPSAVPCPTDLTLRGYTSMLALNADLRHHAIARLEAAFPSDNPSFLYILCPQSKLHVDQDPLTIPPQLTLYDATTIQCGREGWSRDDCQVVGGERAQVVLLDSTATDKVYGGSVTATANSSEYDSNASASFQPTRNQHTITFRGITFLSSQEVSIAALSSKTHAIFDDCHWKDAHGYAAILAAPIHALSWPQDLLLETGGSGNSSATNVMMFAVDENASKEDDNIWKRSRRRLRNTSQTYQFDHSTATSTEATSLITPIMKVTCHGCTFEDCGRDDDRNDFVLIDSHMPGAQWEIISSKVQRIKGASMVANIEEGGILKVQGSIIRNCTTSIAVLRVQSGSRLEMIDSLLEHTSGGTATIAVVGYSYFNMQSSQLHANRVDLASVVALDSSHVTVEHSCLSVYEAPNYEPEDKEALSNIFLGSERATTSLSYRISIPAIIVDPSSFLKDKEDGGSLQSNSLTRIIGTWADMSSRAIAISCSITGGIRGVVPAIWRLDSDASCLESSSSSSYCQAKCEGMLTGQCTLSAPAGIPNTSWGGIPKSSSHSNCSSVLTVGWWICSIFFVLMLQ